MSTLFLCGATNPEGVRLAIRVGEASTRWQRILLLDDDPSTHGERVLGIEVLGPLDELRHAGPEDEVGNLVARKTATRAKVRARIVGMGRRMASLVHPSVDTLGVQLPRDVTVYPQAILGGGSSLGEGSIVFMNGTLGHGAATGECCVVAAGAVLNARVRLANRVYVGTNASVLPDLHLGDDVTVGAGSAVVRDVPAHATVLGVPGEVLLAPPAVEESRAPAEMPSPSGNPADEELQEALARAWSEVLGRSPRPQDRFFECGGTSLSALELCARLRGMGVDLSVTQLFREPCFGRLMEHLSHGRDNGDGALARARRRAEQRLRGRPGRS